MDRASTKYGKGLGGIIKLDVANHDIELRKLPK